MSMSTKIPGEWPSSRWSWTLLAAASFAVQWFGVRLGVYQEFNEIGNVSAGLKPPLFVLEGWTVPLTGWFGIPVIATRRRLELRLFRSSRPLIRSFERKRAAS